MKFPELKAILVGGILTSIFVGTIFVSCHSIEKSKVNGTANFHTLLINQDISEPCCIVQSGGHTLYFSSQVILAPKSVLQSNIPVVSNSLASFKNIVDTGVYPNVYLHSSSTAEVPLYNYLTAFAAQGHLQPLIYNTV